MTQTLIGTCLLCPVRVLTKTNDMNPTAIPSEIEKLKGMIKAVSNTGMYSLTSPQSTERSDDNINIATNNNADAVA